MFLFTVSNWIWLMALSNLLLSNGETTIIIEVNADSDSMTVTCSFMKDKTSKIVNPYSLFLAKSNHNYNTFDTFAKISSFSKPQSLLPNNDSVQMDGFINGEGSSNLQFTSASSTLKSVQRFRCTVSGFDESENFVSESKTIEAREVISNVSDLIKRQNQKLNRLNKIEKREAEFESDVFALNRLNEKRVADLFKTEIKAALAGLVTAVTEQIDQKFIDLKELCHLENSDEIVQLKLNATEESRFTYGFRYKSSKYYLSKSDVVKVAKAATDCAEYGGYNVEINNWEEYNAIVSVLKSNAKFSGTIIGLTDEGNETNWYFPSSKKPANFLLWNVGEANQDTVENCAVLWQPFDYKMVDIKCSDHYSYSFHYLCEIHFQK